MHKHWWLKTEFDESLKKKPRGTLRIMLYATVLCIGYADHRLGYQFGFSLFYLVPVILAARNMGTATALLISLLAVDTWFFTDSLAGYPYKYGFVPYWNAVIRFGFFWLIIMIFDGWEKEKANSRLDALTMVTNRRGFFEFGEAEIKRCKRYGHPFSIIYLDVDNFKTINDRFGHREGDKVLMHIAELLAKNFRETDMVARLGGDEFAILLVETGPEAAKSALGRIADRLSALPKLGSAVTMSIGMATFTQQPPNTFEEALKKADELMYLTKNRGKNGIQCEVYSGPHSRL